MKLWCVAAVGAASLALAGVPSISSAAAPAGASGQVVVVQAFPDALVTVAIDGRSVGKAVAVGKVLGPFDLSAGTHEVRFTDPTGEVSLTSGVKVGADSNSDVVLHRPASVGGDAVVNVYRTPTKPIGPGKSRILVAHTATVAPADVRVDDSTIFTNIANGEFADADVPSGDHEVELLPTGQTNDPILGPLDVALKPQTVTMVYAVGTPSDRSMDVVTHVETVASDGSIAPDKIDTGSAGRASSITVTAFDTRRDPVMASVLRLLAAAGLA